MSVLDSALAPQTEPGHRMVALGFGAMFTILAVDLLLGADVGLFFDLCFIVLCLVLAIRVDRESFFTVAMLPPALMVVGFTIVAFALPSAIAHPQDSTIQALITGVMSHAVGLAVGYTLCLGTLLARMLGD